MSGGVVERLRAASVEARDSMHGFEFADIALAADLITDLVSALEQMVLVQATGFGASDRILATTQALAALNRAKGLAG